MFITLTADDAIQSYTLDALNALIKGRKNPNGCPVSTTYFNSLDYTNYSMVTDWYVAGHEIADHTMTHVGQPSSAEVSASPFTKEDYVLRILHAIGLWESHCAQRLGRPPIQGNHWLSRSVSQLFSGHAQDAGAL